MKGDKDVFVDEYDEEINSNEGMVKIYVMWLIVGFLLLVVSLCMLVWGVVEVVIFFGVSDIIIGLMVIVIGILLLEFVLLLMVVKKGEYDLVIGNVIGFNMFNILVVVGIVGIIQLMVVGFEFLYCDVMVMFVLIIVLFIFCIGIKC